MCSDSDTMTYNIDSSLVACSAQLQASHASTYFLVVLQGASQGLRDL